MGLSVFNIKMEIELCAYSGYKIYPSRGRTLIKSDGKVYKFLDGRSMKAHLLKRNPRKVTWTVLYRRKHKKGIEEETAKNALREPKSSKELLLEPLFKISWPRGIKNPRFARLKENKPFAPLKS